MKRDYLGVFFFDMGCNFVVSILGDVVNLFLGCFLEVWKSDGLC